MKHYRIAFTVPETKLTTIVGALTGEVQDLNISPAEQIDGFKPKRTRTPSPNGHRLTPPHEGRRTVQIVLGAMKPGHEYKVDALGEVLAREGYAPSSASPTLCDLCAMGKVERTAPKTYRMKTLV